MEATRGAISCLFVIILITKLTEAATVNAGEGSTAASAVASGGQESLYKARKRQHWNKFLQFLETRQPPLTLESCSGAHVVEFLEYWDKSGRTKMHVSDCSYFDNLKPPAWCACPFKRAWGTLKVMINVLRAAYKDSGGRPESNPFGGLAVRTYLRQVRECQGKARGIPYQRKKRKLPTVGEAGSSSGGVGSERAADIFLL